MWLLFGIFDHELGSSKRFYISDQVAMGCRVTIVHAVEDDVLEIFWVCIVCSWLRFNHFWDIKIVHKTEKKQTS